MIFPRLQLIAEGQTKLASVPSGGAAPAASAGAASGGAAAADAAPAEEKKEEAKEEYVSQLFAPPFARFLTVSLRYQVRRRHGLRSLRLNASLANTFKRISVSRVTGSLPLAFFCAFLRSGHGGWNCYRIPSQQVGDV